MTKCPYKKAGFYCRDDGVYNFVTEREDGMRFNFIEEFRDKKPTGKFGGPPQPFGKLVIFYLAQ